MYFLSEEEKKILLKGYLPKARGQEIAEELRGWNWYQPPLAPVYDISLAVYEVASNYCESWRDLYLKKVARKKLEPSLPMVEGAVLHKVLADLLIKAKELIYYYGPEKFEQIIKELDKPFSKEFAVMLQKRWPNLQIEGSKVIEQKAAVLHKFEKERIKARLQEILAKQPYIGKDSLAALTIPLVLEQKLDGRFLGLSANLSADAYTFTEPMIIDLKFGEPKPFHRLATTGYALVMEALYEYPVNLACIVYAKFADQRLFINREIHIIDDELRQWFIENRDEKARMLYEELDPGVVGNCGQICPNYQECCG